MSDLIDRVLRTFPPRPLTEAERELLLDWVETARDFQAFVSERRSDDPAIYRRVVVSHRNTQQHLYLIHCPKDLDCWIMVSPVGGKSIGRFASLRTALEYIGPVTLASRTAGSSAARQRSIVPIEQSLSDAEAAHQEAA